MVVTSKVPVYVYIYMYIFPLLLEFFNHPKGVSPSSLKWWQRSRLPSPMASWGATSRVAPPSFSKTVPQWEKKQRAMFGFRKLPQKKGGSIINHLFWGTPIFGNTLLICFFQAMNGESWVPSLKLRFSPLKIGRSPKGNDYSNHPFSGAMFVSGRVNPRNVEYKFSLTGYMVRITPIYKS